MNADWVHPSVRDVAIEYLMTHETIRQRFLESCSIHGALLAISTAGGAEGKRTLPLLQEQEDWRALTNRFALLAGAQDSRFEPLLLRGLHAVLRSGKTDEHPSGHRDDLRLLARETLDGLREKWNGSTNPIAFACLSLWYQVSEAAEELVASPDLRATWDDSLNRAQRASQDPDLDTNDLTCIDRLFDLHLVIVRNEPRFIRIASCRDAVEAIASEATSKCREHVSSFEILEVEEWVDTYDSGMEYREPVEPTADERDDADWLEDALPLLQSIRTFGGASSAGVDGLLAQAEEHHAIRQERAELRQAWEESHVDRDVDWDSPREEGAGNFDIDEFFADL